MVLGPPISMGRGYPRFWTCIFKSHLLPAMCSDMVEFRSASSEIRGIRLEIRDFRPLISELAERNSTISGHMAGSKYDLKMHVQNLGCPLPIEIGSPKTTFFQRFCDWPIHDIVFAFHRLLMYTRTRRREIHFLLLHKRLALHVVFNGSFLHL